MRRRVTVFAQLSVCKSRLGVEFRGPKTRPVILGLYRMRIRQGNLKERKRRCNVLCYFEQEVEICVCPCGFVCVCPCMCVCVSVCLEGRGGGQCVELAI